MISAAKLTIAILAAGALGAFAAELANLFAGTSLHRWAALVVIFLGVPLFAIVDMAAVCSAFDAIDRRARRWWRA